MSRTLRFRVAFAFGAIGLGLCMPAVLGQNAVVQPDVWFGRPAVVPLDVFDLQPFDRFRSSQAVLDVPAAEVFLEALSDRDLRAAQDLFDVFAWKAFIALNWAARPDGAADQSKGFDDDTTPRVWESWKRPADVFLPDGRRPEAWEAPASEALDHFKAAWRTSTTVNEGKQAFSGPLIDQNGRWVHYVSFMNRREFDYVVEHELYNLEGQAAFVRSNEVRFPVNDDTRAGAIEIKLAWKVLTDTEVRSGRFFVRRLPVVTYRPAGTAAEVPAAHLSGRTTDNQGSSATKVETVGLIGMHIAMPTRSSPQGIWATFEHVDNTELDLHSDETGHPLPAKPSLRDPGRPEALVSANLLPPYNAGMQNGASVNDWDEWKPLPPVEVLRLVPPPTSTARVNQRVQAFLRSRGSIFRFYELVGTQWPKHPRSPAVPGGQGSAPESVIRKTPGEVVPVYLVNSTMETYFQKGFQQAGPLEEDARIPVPLDTTMVFGTESCVGCHYSAGACIGFRKNTAGELLRDASGRKIPMFGKNSLEGRSASASFSWLLQLEAKSKEPTR